MSVEKEIEKKYMELQISSQHIKQLQKQLMLLNNQLAELSLLQQSILEFSSINVGSSILVAIGNGIYAKAELKNNQEFIVNVGANVTVKKDAESTNQLLQAQIDEIKGVYEQLMQEIKLHYEQASSLEEEINKLAKNIK